jgi:hypothetical protein
MPYEWLGPGVLTRINGEDIEPEATFEPTDAELKSFSEAITEVSSDAESETDTSESDAETAEDTDVSEASDDLTAGEHWRSAVADIEAGEYDNRLDEVTTVDDRQSVQEAVEARKAEL